MSLSPQFRACLTIRSRDELGKIYERIDASPHVCGSVLRNRRNKELVVAHLIWKVDPRSISSIKHQNIATVTGIFCGFHNGLCEEIVLQQHAELTLGQLPQLTEVELASSCKQLVDGFQYLVSTSTPFPVKDVCVNLYGVLKIVLDLRFEYKHISSKAEEYWNIQYSGCTERLFSLQSQSRVNLSSLGAQFRQVSCEQGIPSIKHEFLLQSRGPTKLKHAVDRAITLLLQRR